MVQVLPSGIVVAVYSVMAAPPLLVGAVHVTVADDALGVAVTLFGTPGTVDGVAAADAAEAVEKPPKFEALTVNVYAVPFVKPVTKHVSSVVVAQVLPPGDAVTKYPVIVPFGVVGAFHETINFPLELLFAGAVTVGAANPLGTLDPLVGITAVLAALAAEEPLKFFATTVNV